jgi:gliding motility-associated-like protein
VTIKSPNVITYPNRFTMEFFTRGSKKFFFFLLFSSLVLTSFGQMEVTNAPPITPENLITNVFLGEGVEVISVSYQGNAKSVGFFKNAESAIGIERGLVLTTGNAVSEPLGTGVDAPGSSFASVNSQSTATDADLLAIAQSVNPNVGIFNVTKYVITFIPTSDTLRFRYSFASEEYPEFVCSQYNDIFGFFISGPGISGPYQNGAENIALIPETNLPVTINNVNSGAVGSAGSIANCTPPLGSLAYSQYYNDNSSSNSLPVYDGITDVFIAEAVVQPCQVYTIKLVICDVGDSALDSGVFLEAKSFGTGSLKVETLTASLDGSVAEGCSPGMLTFYLPTITESDYPIDFQIFGTAINGVDYELIPDVLFIPAGDSSISIPIIALEDGIAEDVETLIIDVQRDPCNRDTITIPIRDNPLVEPDLGLDRTICEGESVLLDGTLGVPLPEPPSFTNDQDFLIDPTHVPVFSPIQAFGVIPPVLGPGVIRKICIDSLSHRWIDDVDVYLISPGGQFLELTTDNGGNGGNGLGMDYYINTCFTEEATVPINFPGPFAPPSAVPFTGDWLPEGVWSDLWGGPTNGTWRLQLVDDQNGLIGTLHSWTIVFNPVYDIQYSWQPGDGLSCADCPDPSANPAETTTYVMTATDSYGCSVADTISFEVLNAPPAPDISCGTLTQNSITVVWNDVPGANGYEISIDNGGWITPNGSLSHTVDGLNLAQQVTFEIRTLGDCPGPSTILQCATPDCVPASTTVLTTPVSCFGGTNGGVSLQVTGGTPPFEFAVNGETNTTGVFTDLSAGTYLAVIVDGVGCPGNVSFTIDQPDGLVLSPTIINDLNCFGDANGTATIDISGGTGPFTFQWSDGQTDPVAQNLAAGLHFATITDGNGCSQIDSVLISQPDELIIDLNFTDVSCGGGSDGEAAVIASGGIGPYEYIWDAAAGSQTTATATLLGAGTFEVIVTDANGCIITGATTVSEPEALSLQLSGIDVSCAGGQDGALEAAVSGGTGPFTYSWIDLESGNPVGTNPTVSGMASGTYEVLVLDAASCEIRETLVISEPEPLNAYSITTAPLCAQDANGTATVDVTGGTPPYSYNWSDIGAGPGQRADLPAGVYTLAIADANGCSLSHNLEVPSTEPILLSFATTPAGCNGGGDGTATVTATGGAGGYQFLWNDNQTGATAGNLSAGPALVTVTDANGCQATGQAQIDEFAPLQLSVSGQDPSCHGGDNGSATVTVEGGAGGYQFQWSDGQSQATALGLSAGIIYQVTATDANQCQGTIEISLNQPEALTVSSSAEPVSCFGGSNGTAVVTVSGGVAPYSYQWSDPAGQSTVQATNLQAGLYFATVTDAHNCTTISSVEVSAPSEVSLDLSAGDVNCNGGSDGQINVIASGGVGGYSYTWNPASIPNTPNPQGLSAGNYSVTVSDANGCVKTAGIALAQPPAIALTAVPSNVNCARGSDGAIDLTATGGVNPYAFLWSNGLTTEDLSGLAAGAYHLSLTDANGCLQTLSVNITEPSSIKASFDISPVECYGLHTGGVRANVQGGVAPYDYQWSNGVEGPVLEQMPAGNYILRVTDANGCLFEEEIAVPQPEAPVSAEIGVEDVSCFDSRDGLISVNAQGGTPFYSYSLDGENFSGSSRMIGLKAGSYRVYIKDSKGCLFTSGDVLIDEPDPLVVDLGPDIVLENYGAPAYLDAEVSGANGMVVYEWIPSDTERLSCLDCPDPIANVLTQTVFRLRVTDENGCTAEDLITIFVRKNRTAFVPTGFTPNGDGANDRLLVHGQTGMKVISFRVYDRWGEMLYEDGDFLANSDADGWDGTFRGRPMNAGVYIWQLEVEYVDGDIESFAGSTTLIR